VAGTGPAEAAAEAAGDADVGEASGDEGNGGALGGDGDVGETGVAWAAEMA
jgi:hypothetical protein